MFNLPVKVRQKWKIYFVPKGPEAMISRREHKVVNPLTPKIRLFFSPQSVTHFLVDLLGEFGIRSR